MLYTTLREIKSKHPCDSGWSKLLENLNKSSEDDEKLSFKFILESNGIKDAIWALRVLDYSDRCLFLADVAESVLNIFEKKYPNDKRPRNSIVAVRDYKAGGITKEKLRAAADAAYAAAAYAATYAAAAYAADAYAAYAAYAAAGRAFAAGVAQTCLASHLAALR